MRKGGILRRTLVEFGGIKMRRARRSGMFLNNSGAKEN